MKYEMPTHPFPRARKVAKAREAKTLDELWHMSFEIGALNEGLMGAIRCKPLGTRNDHHYALNTQTEACA